MSNRKVVITNGNDEEVKTVEIKNNDVDITLDDSDGWVLANLGDDETESLEWRLVMAEHHNKRLSHENAALREALRLKELECKALYQHNFNLSLRNKQLEEKLADVWGVLYGKGFEVVGFHLNGDLEPMDSFFDNNDWNF